MASSIPLNFRDPKYWSDRAAAMKTSDVRLAAYDNLRIATMQLLASQTVSEQMCENLAKLAFAYKSAHEVNAAEWAKVPPYSRK